MRLYTAAQARELDRRTIEEHGVPSLTLMENAAAALAEKAADNGAKAILTTDDEKQDVADTVVRVSEADIPVLKMYSMQNVPASVAENETYISYMKKDLETIKKATGR